MSLLNNPYGMGGNNNGGGGRDPMDNVRLLSYGFLMLCMFLSYDIYIAKPQREALQKEKAEIVKVEQGIAAPVKRDEALATSTDKRATFENDFVTASVNLTGARLDDLTLNNYYEELDKKDHVALLSPSNSKNPHLIQYGWLTDDTNTIVPNGTTKWTSIDNGEKNVQTLRWTSPQNITFEQKIELDDKTVFKVTQKVINNSGKSVTLYPFGRVTREGVPELSNNAILHEGMISYIDGELTQDDFKDLDKKRTIALDNGHGWLGITDKYWLVALLNPETEGSSDYRFTSGIGQFDRPLYQADARGKAITIDDNGQASSMHHTFAGPKDIDLLIHYEESLNLPHFDLAIDFGKFYFLTRPIFSLLHFLSNGVGSFAIGLLLTALIIRAITFPLANTTYRNFAKLRKLAPQMKEMKEKYGDDRARMQQELFKFYKKEQVNPAAGCFPMLLQIPIFFALYKVIFVTLEMRHQPFFGWIEDMSVADPTSIGNLFGLLPFDSPGFIAIGIWPCIYCITMLLLQRLQPPPTEGSQRTVMMLLPFIFTVVLAGFPAGLVIYWSWSNVLSIIQQSIIMKSMGVEIHLFKFGKKKKNELDEVFIVDVSDDSDMEMVESTEVKPDKKITPPKRKK